MHKGHAVVIQVSKLPTHDYFADDVTFKKIVDMSGLGH